MLATFGLTQAHRYWVAKDPDMRFDAFLERDALFVSRWLGSHWRLPNWSFPIWLDSAVPEVMRLVRIYLVNIPAALVQFLMIGLLEGGRGVLVGLAPRV